MPRAPARGRPPPLTLTVQILDLEVVVRTEDARIAKTLDIVRQTARHRFPTARSIEYEITAVDGGFEITEEGSRLVTAPYPIDVLMVVDGHVYAPALAPYVGTPAALLYASCVRVGGTRLLLVGDRDPRRAALLLQLLTDGAAVEGDWHVLLDEGLVTTVARTFRLAQEAVDVLPGAAALVAGRPFVRDGLGRVIWSLDPAAAGFDWELDAEPVEAIVVVESNPGGRSRLEPRPRYETAQEVVAAVAAIPGEVGDAVPVGPRLAAVSRLVDACSCWRLRLGDLGEASRLLQKAFARH